VIKEDLQDIAKEVTVDYLQNHPLMIQIKAGLREFQKLQETLTNLAQSGDEKALLSIKVGTAITWEIILNLAEGKHPKDYSNEDWASVINKSVDESINCDPTEYSKNVFLIYANYIEVSAATLDVSLGKDACTKTKQIKLIADEIRKNAKNLENGKITEVKYIDECLWLSLEAMIKLLSTSASKILNEEGRVLVEGITQYTFEYGRLALYQQEQALLEEILEHQGQVDVDLQEKYDAYISEINLRSETFMQLINNAFDEDFKSQLKGSVALAREAGVSEEEILDSISKIDDFFS